MAVKAKMKVIVLKSSAAASIKTHTHTHTHKNKMLKFQLCHYLVLTLCESFKFFETWFLPL